MPTFCHGDPPPTHPSTSSKQQCADYAVTDPRHVVLMFRCCRTSVDQRIAAKEAARHRKRTEGPRRRLRPRLAAPLAILPERPGRHHRRPGRGAKSGVTDPTRSRPRRNRSSRSTRLLLTSVLKPTLTRTWSAGATLGDRRGSIIVPLPSPPPPVAEAVAVAPAVAATVAAPHTPPTIRAMTKWLSLTTLHPLAGAMGVEAGAFTVALRPPVGLGNYRSTLTARRRRCTTPAVVARVVSMGRLWRL